VLLDAFHLPKQMVRRKAEEDLKIFYNGKSNAITGADNMWACIVNLTIIEGSSEGNLLGSSLGNLLGSLDGIELGFEDDCLNEN